MLRWLTLYHLSYLFIPAIKLSKTTSYTIIRKFGLSDILTKQAVDDLLLGSIQTKLWVFAINSLIKPIHAIYTLIRISFIDFILFFQIITNLRFKVILSAKPPNSLITRWWWRRNVFHPLYRDVGGDWKEKKGLKDKNTKKEIFFSFCRRKERQSKCLFSTSRLIFITPVYNDPTENEKKKFTHFLNLCFRFENTEFRIISKHSHLFLFQHSVF